MFPLPKEAFQTPEWRHGGRVMFLTQPKPCNPRCDAMEAK